MRPNTTNGWIISALLLAAFFTVPRLDYDDLSHDELRSYIVAGGAHHTPMSNPAQVWARVAEQSPDQAMGFPLVIWFWGQFMGWSEFAARVLPFFAGLLTVVMAYRIGRGLFHPFVGMSAAFILATSIYFITFMHYFRVFALAALAASVTFWLYWRVVYHRAGWRSQVGLVLAGVSLAYSHYFVAPFLAVLGIYHVIFAPKTRRWWLPVGLLVPVAVVFSAQIPVLLRGFAMNQGKESLQQQAASPVEIVGLVGFYFGHGVVWLSAMVIALGVFAFITLKSHRREMILIWFTALMTLVFIIALNELSGVFEPDRYRYAIALWMPLAVITGTGFWWLNQFHRYAGIGALALWCVIAISITWQDTLTFSDTKSPPWRELAAPVFAYGEPDDVFLYNGKPDSRHGHYTHGIANRPTIIGDQGEAEVNAAIEEALRVWWGRNLNEDLSRQTAIIEQALNERDYVYCDTYLDHEWAWLKLYAQSSVFCPRGEAIAQFGDLLTLMQVEQIQTDEMLTLNTGWQISPQMPINTYSLAFIIMQGDEVITQQDIGLGANDGPYTPVRVVFDLSGLPAGNYELYAAAYNWQTLERLPVVDNIDNMAQIATFRR